MEHDHSADNAHEQTPAHEHERRFQGGADRLRAPERLARLDVPHVTELCLNDGNITSVLDVGTGTGVFAEAFAQAGLAVTGLDVNTELLAIARGHVPTAQFKEGVAEHLPFSDKSFHLVFLGLVLHETDSALTALQEARRVARQRVAILEWPYRDEPYGPPLEHRLKPDAVTALATEAGFSRIDISQLEFMTLYRFIV